MDSRIACLAARAVLHTVAALLAIGISAQTPGQENEKEAAEEQPRLSETVTVTARRVDEDVQRVPMSVSAFTDDDLERLQVRRLDSLTQFAPNVNIFSARSSSSNASLFIRGIGQEDTVFTVDPGVGLYVDDIVLPRAQAALLDVFDVERVEILRGPQGTLYGRNTIAGAVKFVTKSPSFAPETTLRMTAGNYSRVDLVAGTNVPIVDERVALRASIGTFNQEGLEYNVFNGRRTRSTESTAARLSLLVIPSDAVSMIIRADGVRERPSIHVGSLVRPQTTALDYPGLLAGDIRTIPVSDDPFRVRANAQDKMDVDTWGISATIDWQRTRSLTIRSISSLRALRSDTRLDFDATEAQALDVFATQQHRQSSEEVQAIYSPSNRWHTVGGLFLFRENDHQMDGTDASAKGFSLDAMYRQRTASWAGYAQGLFSLTAASALTAGLRYTSDTKAFSRLAEQHVASITQPNYNRFGGYGAQPGGVPPSQFPGNGRVLTNILDAEETWSAFTPRVGYERTTGAGMWFVSVARGFKSGGFNGRANEAANPLQRQPYDPEYVWTYEAGSRTSWIEGRLLWNTTLFYNDYADLQLASFSTADSNGDGTPDTYLPLFTNAGKAVTRGFELDLRFAPAETVQLYAAAGFTDSEYKEYRERGRDLSDERSLPNAPRWTGTAAIVWARPLGWRAMTLETDLNASYQGSRYLTVSNLPDLRQSAYTLFNASVGVRSAGDRWAVTAGLRNATDEHYKVAGLDASSPPFGVVTAFYGEPRTWHVSVSRRL